MDENQSKKVTFVEEFKPSLVRAKIQNPSNVMKIEDQQEKKTEDIPEEKVEKSKNQAQLGMFTAMKVAKWMRMGYGAHVED